MKKNQQWLDINNISPSDLTNYFEELKYLDGNLQILRNVIESGFSHIFITDNNGLIIYANHSSEEITGYRKNEMIGKKPSLWGNQMSNQFYESFWKTIKIEKLNFNGIITNRRKNGELYEAEIIVSPMMDSNGEVKFFIALERDITREKEVDKAKIEFISLAAHELKTPLSTISLASEMLMRDIVGDISRENKRYLKTIIFEIKNMIEMIEKFLNVSRIELGKFPINYEPMRLSEVLDKTVREISHQIKGKKIHFIKDYNNRLPSLLADKKVLQIIIENLLLNSIKYTYENGKVILKVDETSKKIIIKISDNGIGIPESDQPKIFTKMFRAENVFKTKNDGSGLGLYFVKNLINQCGYSIDFKSKEQKGTTFAISIPKKLVIKNKREKRFYTRSL